MLALTLGIVVASASGATMATPASHVVPVDWHRFKTFPQMAPHGDDLAQAAKITLNAARWSFAWAAGSTDEILRKYRDEATQSYGPKFLEHNGLHPNAAAAQSVLGMAIVLKTGLFSQRDLGISYREGVARAARVLNIGLDGHEDKSWGYPWQGALWSGWLGHAGWLLWADLDRPTQHKLAHIVEFEANRLIDYEVPYWNGKDGDTKAEENSWNAMVLQVAVAMMPRHPNVLAWKRKGSELMVSAYSQKKDATNESVLDGRKVKTWVRGYNVFDDGTVVNHNLIHPDYMACITLQSRAFLVQPLAGQPVPESTDFNADVIYKSFVMHRFLVPPFARSPPLAGTKPGLGEIRYPQTIYRPGTPWIYYPQGHDWSALRFDVFYQMDVFAHVLAWDKGLPPAADWMRLRAAKILEMQTRHSDGRMFAAGEFDTVADREQMALASIAEGFMLLWLRDQGAMGHKANWMAVVSSRP